MVERAVITSTIVMVAVLAILAATDVISPIFALGIAAIIVMSDLAVLLLLGRERS